MSGGITVKEFKHIPGVNDAEYIKKLEELHEIDKGIISKAVAKIKMLSAQPEQQHGGIFQEIVVEYPSYNTYPEYKGKPYFSIKYTENGQEFIGYGTYKPEVLSKYLKEYFMPSAQPERKTGRWIPDNTDYYRTKFICSACGEFEEVPTTGFGYGTIWNYCPMCGAKMEVAE